MIIGKTTKLPYFPELRGSLDAMKFPALVEPKLDGELGIWNGMCLINKYGKTRRDFPAVNKLTTADCIGELYTNQGLAGELYTLSKNKTSDNLKFTIFDIPVTDLTLVSRREVMFETFPKESIIEARVASTKEEALALYQLYIVKGYEGAVVKSLDSMWLTGPCSWVKIKHKDRSQYQICLIDTTQERIEVMVPIPPSPGNLTIIQKYVKVGVKCISKYKVKLKVGDFCTVEHQGVLVSGSLRHPVYIK